MKRWLSFYQVVQTVAVGETVGDVEAEAVVDTFLKP